MKTHAYIAIVTLTALFFFSPALASNSVELSTERGHATEAGGYLFKDRASTVPQSDAGSVQLTSAEGFPRGYFIDASAERPIDVQSIDQSRENGGN